MCRNTLVIFSFTHHTNSMCWMKVTCNLPTIQPSSHLWTWSKVCYRRRSICIGVKVWCDSARWWGHASGWGSVCDAEWGAVWWFASWYICPTAADISRFHARANGLWLDWVLPSTLCSHYWWQSVRLQVISMGAGDINHNSAACQRWAKNQMFPPGLQWGVNLPYSVCQVWICCDNTGTYISRANLFWC